ncbi:unnamed protein product [Polarella glacialis]|uniref:GPAT/DHAPAT C-terminal domain-containing protein n=1 Tax=Polarella glacialis TaxID=89957 RepID=A0A813FKZ4_POLGL|nr:unnamed protein product [Polarella glacialis]
METKTYATELLGNKKRQESLLGSLGQAQRLLAMSPLRYGNIHVRIAPGFSAKDCMDRYTAQQRQAGPRPRFDPCTSASDRAVLLKAMAYHVLDEINRVSSVTPTALVGTALLTTLEPGIGRAKLLSKVHWLRGEVVRCGGHMSHFFDFPLECMELMVDSALAVLGSLVDTTTGLAEPVYSVAHGRHFELSYYRNMCVQVFVHQSIIAAVLHRFVHLKPDVLHVRQEEVMHDTRFLSRLLKREFVFSGEATHVEDGLPTALMHNFKAALELLVSARVVQVSHDDPAVIELKQLCQARQQGGFKSWNAHFTFLCFFVWPVIETYWLVLAGLLFILRQGSVAMNEDSDDVLSRLQVFAKTLFYLGRVHFHESASEEPLRKALQTYEEMGVMRWERRLDEEGICLVKLHLGTEYQDGDGFLRLSQLVDTVASYRCRWRDHEGMQDYEEHIARLSFISKL